MSQTNVWLGGLVVSVSLLVCALSLLFGMAHNGIGYPALQCLGGPYAAEEGPNLESTRVIAAERTWFPLGLSCTYDQPDDGFGPQTVTTYKVGPTVGLTLGVLGCAFGGIVVARSRVR